MVLHVIAFDVLEIAVAHGSVMLGIMAQIID
jgi:hypothetical protein